MCGKERLRREGGNEREREMGGGSEWRRERMSLGERVCVCKREREYIKFPSLSSLIPLPSISHCFAHYIIECVTYIYVVSL